MDQLFDKAKEIFPEASDDEIMQGISQIRQQAPQASDDEILKSAVAMKQAKDDGSFVKQMATQGVKEKYGLADRQAIVDQNKEDASGINWQAGLAALGSGLRGGNALEAGMSVVNQQEAGRQNKLKEFDAQKAQYLADRNDAASQEKLKRESDPNSLESKQAQDLAIAMGMKPDLAKGLTAARFKELGPLAEAKYKIAQTALDRKEARVAKSEQRNDKLSDDLVIKMQKDLDPNQARGGNLAKNQAQMDQADRLKALYTESNGDIRNLDSRQIEELAIGMNKMLSGSSQGSSSQVEALVPKTARGNASKLKEWLLNDPQGTNQIEFVKRMAETVERERQVAGNQIKNAQVQRLSAYNKLKKADPERYKQVLNAYGIDDSDIDETGHYMPAKAQGQGPMAKAGPVRMKDPQGNIRLVPAEQVAAAKQAGGVVVDEAVADANKKGPLNGI